MVTTLCGRMRRDHRRPHGNTILQILDKGASLRQTLKETGLGTLLHFQLVDRSVVDKTADTKTFAQNWRHVNLWTTHAPLKITAARDS